MRQQKEFDEHLPAVKVMRRFGTNSRLAKALGVNTSTTYRYLNSGYFVGNDPAALFARIHAAARENGVTLEPTDFVDLRLFAPA